MHIWFVPKQKKTNGKTSNRNAKFRFDDNADSSIYFFQNAINEQHRPKNAWRRLHHFDISFVHISHMWKFPPKLSIIPRKVLFPGCNTVKAVIIPFPQTHSAKPSNCHSHGFQQLASHKHNFKYKSFRTVFHYQLF